MRSHLPERGQADAAASWPAALAGRWAWPALFVTVLVGGIFLPEHGVRGVVDLGTSTITTLGMLALSVASPLAARAAVVGEPWLPVLSGARRSQLDSAELRPSRRLLALAIGAVVRVGWLSGTGVLVAGLPPTSTAHAVSLIVGAANAWLLLGYLLPIPGFEGWSVLLALVDGTGTPTEVRVARARRLARPAIIVLGAVAGAGLVAIGHPFLVLWAMALVWWGWSATAAAEADDLLRRYLAERRAADLTLPATKRCDAEAPMVEAIGFSAGQPVALVFQAGALVGAIGPRQVHRAADADTLTCGQAMVPVADIEILPADAPAAAALGELGRHGFALVRSRGAIGYLESGELRARAGMVSDIQRRVADDERGSR